MSAPFLRTLQAHVGALGATTDATENVGAAPFAGTVSEVSYTPDAAIAGANTNTRTLSLVNKGQDGTGTTVVATLALTSGVNIAASDEGQLTLSATPANRVVANDDILAFTSVHASSGLADPGGLVEVGVNRT